MLIRPPVVYLQSYFPLAQFYAGKSCGSDATCVSTGVCSSTATPRCNPVNYLDISGTEDNANFSDISAAPSANGFINGIVRDASSSVLVNDRLALITYQDLMPKLEKRVAAEVANCLKMYANSNNARYPWAAPVSDVTTPFSDLANTVFGRIPDNLLSQTQFGTSTPTSALTNACNAAPNKCMATSWPATCLLPVNPSGNSWWNNWKLHVFYGIADAYKPMISFTQPTPSTVILNGITPTGGCPTCLTVQPGTASDKQFVVILAGKQISAAQPRLTTADKQTLANYLEGENSNGDTVFTRQTNGTAFNDVVISSPP
jgi:hypothetical protein